MRIFFVIQYGVLLFADGVTVTSGLVALGSIASIAVIGIAILAVVVGIALLFRTKETTVTKYIPAAAAATGDPTAAPANNATNALSDVEFNYARLSELMPANGSDPSCVCCIPCTAPTPDVHRIRVSFSDRNKKSGHIKNEKQNRGRDQTAITTCVKKIENHKQGATGGCCQIIEDSHGDKYSVGVSSGDPSNFKCYQDKH